MPRRLASYYFGRLNVMAQFVDKKEFLLTGLQTKKTIEKGEHLWGFFNVGELSYAKEDFLSGYLVKLRPKTEEEVADIETHHLEYEEIENRAVAKSLFFLHVKSGLIAYHPVGRHIRDYHFRKVFARLLEAAYDDFFINAEIQTVEDRIHIFEAINRFQRIMNVSIYLHPTNPNYDIAYKLIDERIKNLEADSYTEIYKASPEGDGLKIKDDKEIEGKITMADDGYGEARVTGEIDGKIITVSTKDNPITAEAPSKAEPPSVLGVLWATFEHIRERFRNDL